jgi:hypothetical protein
MTRNYVIKVSGQYVILTESQYEYYLIYGIVKLKQQEQ